MKRIFQHFQYFIWLSLKSWFWSTGKLLSAFNGIFQALFLLRKSVGWDSNLNLIAPIVLGTSSCPSLRLTLKGYARLVLHTLVMGEGYSRYIVQNKKGKPSKFHYFNRIFPPHCYSGTSVHSFFRVFSCNFCKQLMSVVRCDVMQPLHLGFAGTSRKCWHHGAVQTWRSQD